MRNTKREWDKGNIHTYSSSKQGELVNALLKKKKKKENQSGIPIFFKLSEFNCLAGLKICLDIFFFSPWYYWGLPWVFSLAVLRFYSNYFYKRVLCTNHEK